MLITHLIIYLTTHLMTHLMTHLTTHLITHLTTHLITHLTTHLITHMIGPVFSRASPIGRLSSGPDEDQEGPESSSWFGNTPSKASNQGENKAALKESLLGEGRGAGRRAPLPLARRGKTVVFSLCALYSISEMIISSHVEGGGASMLTETEPHLEAFCRLQGPRHPEGPNSH
ncbi:hypothetical protein EYF80_056447 [Liparis tanakae]|uniref:Uncharacterized protein n=1 Tax=Liparis tanakae TaxID=230148 RepID=A0A4Z2EXB6_9TELE|nr:hypothetical protein EYF80_056447 [Liparis tanakae]